MAPTFLSTHGEPSAWHHTANVGAVSEVSGPRLSSTSYENEMVQNFGQSTAISLDVLNLQLSTPGPVVCQQGVVSVLSSGRSGMQQADNSSLTQGKGKNCLRYHSPLSTLPALIGASAFAFNKYAHKPYIF